MRQRQPGRDDNSALHLARMKLRMTRMTDTRLPPEIALAQRRFSIADQRRFADLSGDVNPMHMDPIAARRLLSGQLVVHGVHTLLAALEMLGPDTAAGTDRLSCDFINPQAVDDEVDFALAGDDAATVVTASVRGLVCTRVTLDKRPAEGPVGTSADPMDSAGLACSPTPVVPMAQLPEQWMGQSLRFRLPAANCSADFPALCARVGERRVAAMALLSTFVGMVCPGLHSVFSSISLGWGPPSAEIDFKVLKYDPRFRLFVVRFDGCISGELRAFLRPPPQPQPSTRQLLGLVAADRYFGTRSWVMGGSRGLGEFTAKLIAAGGGDVDITYAAGAADAATIVADINGCGRGRAAALTLDLLNTDICAWMRGRPTPDAVFYFATPKIFRKKSSVFDSGLFNEFIAFYGERFQALCLALEENCLAEPVKVFVPSTVSIDERPKGMTEYTMAKAAVEILCADLQRSLRRVRIVVQRLPRLETDQTASLMAVKSASMADTLLPMVNLMLPTRPNPVA